MHAYPSPVGLGIYVRSITHRKQLEKELDRSEERLRLFVQRVYDSAIVFCDADGHVTSWNVGAERMYRYRRSSATPGRTRCFEIPSAGGIEMTSVAEVQIERARDLRTESVARRERVQRARGFGRSVALLGAAALAAAGLTLGQRRVRARRAVGRLLGEAAGDLGRGLLAGALGTLAITVASTVDELVTELVHARKEERKPELDVGKAIVSPWSFSAGVVSKVVGLSPTDERHERRLSMMAHWGYGSTWGVSLAAMRAFGLRRLVAVSALLAGQLAAEMIVMPAFDLFPPPTQWGRRAVVSSVYQHAIYALAAVTAFEWLDPGGVR